MTGFPYSLEINVHKAENLPASSLSLSETYVILSIEGAELGRTGFAVKNKVSYIWKEVFSTGLLHVAEGRITFSLFYFQESTSIDKGGEFIGKCDVGLPNLSRDGKPHFIRSPLVKTMEGEETETSSQGFLFFSVKLQQNNSMFTILDKPESRRKLSPEVMLNIKRELDAFSATILERRLLTETVKDLSGWSYCQHECISDILKDMRSLEEGEIHRPAEDLLPFISRRRRGLRCATTFQVDSHTFQPSLPMNQDLQMALWCEGSIVLNLSFSSRWKLWQAMSLLLSVLDSFPSSCTKPPHLHLENEIVTKIICTNNSLDADAVSFQPAKLVFSSSLDESSPAFIDIIPVKDCGLALYEEYARRILLNSIQKVSFGVDSPNTNSYLLVLKFNAFTPDPTMVQKPNNKYYLVVQYKSETFSTSLETLPNLHWNQTFEFDVSTHDLEADLSHLHVFLFEKPTGFGPVDLLGEQRISLGVLLRFEEEGGWNKANAEAMMDRWTSRYELLNTRTSIDITVIEAVYLKTAVVGDVFIKCSMVSSVPHTNKEEVCFREFKSSPVRATKKDIPFDGNAIFTLHAREGMQTADLVRLRVLIGSSFHVDIIGQVLIPLSDCCLTEKEALYDVRTVNGTEGSVGQLRIRILRREESIPRTAGVELLSRLRRSHEYNTQWCAECIPSSLLQNEDYFHEESHEGKKARDNNIGQSNRRLSCVENAVEMYKLFPSYENLILVEDNICTLSVGSNDELCFKYEPYALSSYNRIILEEGEEEGEGGVESVYLFYFENERRGALPPHSFLSDHLVVDDDPPHFSDESGLREFVYNEEPPEGYSWMEGNDWFIDSKYYIKQCDSGGWIYADNFYDLRDRCTVYCLTNVFPLLCVKSFDNRHSRKGVATAGDSSSLQVRRRKWTRKVRSDPIPQIKLKSSSYCSYREEYMQNAPSEAIIRYCREKESFRAPVLIPYSQVTALSICSDSILMIQVSIGRFDGVVQEKEVFTDMRMEMFVTNCPALRLKALVEERIAVLPSRQMIGRVFLPVPENQYQESEGYSSLFGVDLRLRIVAFCEDEIARYESKPIKEPHDVIYSTRLKVYLASLCSFSALSNDGHRRVESMEVVTLRGRIDGTLDERESEAEGRVPRLSCCIKDLQLFIAERFRGTLLSGLSMGRKDLKLRLSSLLHDFYHAFINLCGPFFVHSALLPSLESKISFLKVFLNVDNCLEAALQRSFGMIYGFIVSPAPSLSTVLSLDSLITFFMAGTLESFDRMYDSIVMASPHLSWLNRCDVLDNNAMAPHFSVLTDLRSALVREVSCVSGLIETVLAQYKLPLYYFIRRIELACLQSFERLAHNYISALESFPWVPMSTASFDEYNDDDAFLIDHDGDHDRNCRYIWLCKLVQECSLFQSDAFCAFHCVSESDASSLTKSVLRGQSDAALERVKERITEALSAFDETRLFALDCITCILFAQCSPSILHSFSRGQYASLAPLIKTLEESFSNWQNRFSRPVDYSHALEMCADKFVILLLTLIKKANVTSLSETTRLCMATDIELIHKLFRDSLTCKDSESNFAIVELHLKRLSDVFFLLFDAPDSERFLLTCLRLEGESETNEADPEALSLLLHYSLFCREWISLEDHQQSLQQLVKRIHANQSPEDKGIDISVRLFKLSPETRVFRLPSTTLFSNLTRSIQPEAIENRSIALLKSQTIGSDNDLKAYKSLRKVTVKALRATDLVGIDLLGLSFTTPNVYIVLSTGISVIRTPVRLSTLNPSWEEASFEMEYWSTWALREDIYLSFSLYYTSRFGLSADLHYGTAKIPLQITDDISGSFEARSVLISPSNLGAIRNSVAIARKKSAPAAMLHALIVLSDI